MKFIIGIGNPGKEYVKTRHNIGFRVVDELCSLNKGEWKAKKTSKSELARLGAADVFLVKPQTFVNNTGEAVRAIVKEHSLKPQDVLLICDDVNLDFGKMKLRSGGGAGGHHGLESVTEKLETPDFPRLRVGVRNEHMPEDLSGFVLEKFSREEASALPVVIERACVISQTWASEGFSAAQDKLSKIYSLKI